MRPFEEPVNEVGSVDDSHDLQACYGAVQRNTSSPGEKIWGIDGDHSEYQHALGAQRDEHVERYRQRTACDRDLGLVQHRFCLHRDFVVNIFIYRRMILAKSKTHRVEKVDNSLNQSKNDSNDIEDEGGLSSQTRR